MNLFLQRRFFRCRLLGIRLCFFAAPLQLLDTLLELAQNFRMTSRGLVCRRFRLIALRFRINLCLCQCISLHRNLRSLATCRSLFCLSVRNFLKRLFRLRLSRHNACLQLLRFFRA